MQVEERACVVLLRGLELPEMYDILCVIGLSRKMFKKKYNSSLTEHKTLGLGMLQSRWPIVVGDPELE